MKHILLTIFIFLSLFCSAQTQIGKEYLTNFTNGQFSYSYLTYYPQGYDTAKKNYPVFVYLYGLGHDPLDANGKVVTTSTAFFSQGISQEIENGTITPDFIVISIQTPLFNGQPNGWDYSMHPQHIDDVLDKALAGLKYDANRVYGLGVSAGTAALMAHSANANYTPRHRFAAIAPMSTAGDSASVDFKKIVDNNLFGWAWASDPGDAVHGIETHGIVRNVNKLKPDFWRWTNFNGNSHACCWRQAFGSMALYDTLLKYSLHTVATLPPVDTVKKDTVITPPLKTAHKFYPTSGWLNPLVSSLSPGDTIFLSPAIKWDVITLQNFKGDTTKDAQGNLLHPLVIINQSGQAILTGAQSGFQLQGSVGIKITGTGDSNYKYGIKVIDGNFAGISVEGRASNMEFERIEISNKGVGFWIKNEVTCTDSLNFPNWYLHDFYIHDNYVHNMSLEGCYLLSTANDGTSGTQHPTITCNGVATSAIPMRGYGFRIMNNIFDSTGRAAIQLASNDLDTAEIAYNSIKHCGSDPDGYQGNGISIGGHCRAFIHDNTIDYTKKDGIQAFGKYNRIENNHIDHSGNSGMGLTSHAYNIYIVSQAGTPSPQNMPFDTTEFIIKNNFFGSNTAGDTSVFIEYGHGYYSANKNFICGNVGGLVNYARSGINISTNCDEPSPVQDSVIDKIKQHVKKDSVYLPLGYRITSIIDSTGKLLKSKVETLRNKWVQLKDTTYDTTYKKIPADTSAFKPRIGIMPFSTAAAYNAGVTRDRIVCDAGINQPGNLKRLLAYNPDSVLINVIHGSNYFSALPQFKYVIIGNEEDSLNANLEGIEKELTDAIAKMPNSNITNGGLIGVRLWYYNQTHDEDFLNTCITSSWKNKMKQGKIDFVSLNKYYDFLRDLKGLYAVNIHSLYVSNANEFEGLKRMIIYLKNYMKKELLTTECGIYVNDVSLLKGLVNMCRHTGMLAMIIYSGKPGYDKAQPVSEQDFKTVLNS